MVLLTIVQTTSQQSNSKNEGIIDLIGLSSRRKKKFFQFIIGLFIGLTLIS